MKIERLKPYTNQLVLLHKDILIIPFKHRHELSCVFSDVLNLIDINYISITVMNQNSEVINLSSTPAIIFNLINSGLWMYDHLFHKSSYENLLFSDWHSFYCPSMYSALIEKKELPYKYTYGIHLVKKMNNFSTIYSFATKRQMNNANDFYFRQIQDLLNIGDYCYRAFLDIFNAYFPYQNISIPNSDKYYKELILAYKKNKGHIKLIVDNTQPTIKESKHASR